MLALTVILTIAFFTVKGYSGKRASNFVKTPFDAYLFTLFRMMICIVVGIVTVAIDGAFASLLCEWGMLLICLISAIGSAAMLIGWTLAIQKTAMVTVDVSLTLGSMIPAVLCLILFGEEISAAKMIGFLLIILATFILAGYSKEALHKKTGFLGVLYVVIAGVGDGVSSFSQQLYKHYYTECGMYASDKLYPKSVYQFYTYLFVALILLIFIAVYYFTYSNSSETEKESKPSFKIPFRAVMHIAVMAIALFLGTYTQTIAATDYGMPSQILYPVVKGACLITVSINATLFFGERFTSRSVIGSLVALGGIVCMNVL